MNEHDNAVRSVLSELASEAPSPERLADAVQVRYRRHQSRRRMVAAGGLTVIVALVGGGAVTFNRHDNDSVQKVQIIQLATPAGSKQRPAPCPVDIGWLPAGFGKSQLIMLGPGAWGLDTRRGDGPTIGKGFAAIEIQIMAGQPKERKSPGELTKVTVGGKPGSLYWVPAHDPGIDEYGHTPPEAEGPYAELIYQRQPGQWVRIIAENSAGNVDMGLTPADLTRIATSLVDKERSLPDVLRLDVFPGKVEWGRVTNENYGALAEFVPSTTTPSAVGQDDLPNGHNGTIDAPISVQVLPEDAPELGFYGSQNASPSNGISTTSPSSPSIEPGGAVFKGDKVTAALYRLDSNPKLIVLVREKNSFGMSGTDLLKVAASVRLGPAAIVKAN